MRSACVATVTLLLLVSNLVAQEVPVEVPEIIISPGPATLDMVEMLTRYTDPRYKWDRARARVNTFKFYEGNVRVEAPWNTGVNSFISLQRAGVFRIATRELHLNLSMESGVIKPQDCLRTDRELARNVERVLDSVRNIYQSGGNLSSVVEDTSTMNCGYAKTMAGKRVGEWSVLVEKGAYALFADFRANLPDPIIVPLGVGLIEPYPAVSVSEHLLFIDAVVRERSRYGFGPPQYYDIDIDTRRIGSDIQVVSDIDMIIDHLHRAGIKAGLIINGDDSKSQSIGVASEETVLSAERKLLLYRRLNLLSKVDRITVQSWATHPTGNLNQPLAFDIPYSVSENGLSLTWLVNRLASYLGQDSQHINP